MGTISTAAWRWFAAAIIAIGLAGCQVAPYDAETYNASLQNLKGILTFFDVATDATGDDRSYAKLKSRYATIENDLVLLTARERTRAYNNESARSAQTILEGWRDLRRVHRCRYTTVKERAAGEGLDCTKDPVIDYAPTSMSNWVLERQRQHFIAMFEHLMAGEAYKEGAPACAQCFGRRHGEQRHLDVHCRDAGQQHDRRG